MSQRSWNPTARQQEVLRLLADKGPSTAQDIEQAGLGIGATTAHSIFRSFGARGLIDSATARLVNGRYVIAVALTRAGRDLVSDLRKESGGA